MAELYLFLVIYSLYHKQIKIQENFEILEILKFSLTVGSKTRQAKDTSCKCFTPDLLMSNSQLTFEMLVIANNNILNMLNILLVIL